MIDKETAVQNTIEEYLRYSHFRDKIDKLFRNLFSKYMETTFCSFYIFGKWLGDTMKINQLVSLYNDLDLNFV